MGLPVIISSTVAYEFCRCAPSDFACHRASRVQLKQGSGSSRRARDTASTMLHHTGHRGEWATQTVDLTITHKANSVLCNYQRIVDRMTLDLVSVFSRTVKNCAETLGNHSAQLTTVDKLSCQAVNRNPDMWAENSDAISLLTHRQVSPFNIIVMYMRTKYTWWFSIISPSSFSLVQKWWAQNCANIVPMPTTSFWLKPSSMAQHVWHLDVSAFP